MDDDEALASPSTTPPPDPTPGVGLFWRADLGHFWKAPKNGTASLEEMRTRLARYRKADDPFVDYTIGCILLEKPFFLVL